MRLALALLFLSGLIYAHEVQYIGQHVKLNRQGKSGWQQDVLARAVLSPKHEVGLQGTYLERFDLYERRAGALYTFRPNDQWTLEAKWMHATDDADLLPLDYYQLSAYYGWIPGYAPYLFYRKSIYSITHVDLVTLGLEIEKIKRVVLIPQFSQGTARFNDPNETKGVHNYGLRVVYYVEDKYSLHTYYYQGREASQGIVGASSILVNTRSTGFGGAYSFTPTLRAIASFDYTDFTKIQNQFLTTTLNLIWTF